MGKITKNPSQLTDEDNLIIDRICIGCGALFFNIMQQYRNPKEFAEKYLLKNFKSDQSFAAGKIVVNSLYSKYDNLLYPSEINKDLKKESQSRPFESDIEPEQMEVGMAFHKLLNPRDMSGVFRFVEEEGFHLNIRGKKAIRSELGFRPGRPVPKKEVSPNKLHRGGGTPSAYKITELFERTRKVMKKLEAHDRLRKKLLSTELTYSFDRFMHEAIFHCAKLDPTAAANLITIAAPPEKLSQVSEYGPYIKQMSSFNEIQIKLYLDSYSRWMTETKPYDIHFLLSMLKFL